jgi:uridine kinase/Gpi18-like mannosyltransferase
MKHLLYDRHGNSKIPLAKSSLFWIGLGIKIILSVFFASSFLRELFAPFGNYFINSGLSDPYAYFSVNGSGNEFPYPPLMLWILSIPRMILWPIIPGSQEIFTVADSIIYRLPLLAADFVILLVLLRWLKTKTRQVLIWYWLSPVLIYINYFHGQLDAIPMAFLIVSLYFLFKNKWQLAFMFLGFAIGCKTNMALVIPFYMVFIVRTPHTTLKKAGLSILILFCTVFLINLPYLGSEGFIKMVYNNPVQQQVFDLYYQFNSTLRIYFIPSVYFILVIYYMSFRFVNRDQLILFLAFTFLALTLMIAPMQGWYYWIMPLLVYFVVKQSNREKYVFVVLSVFYFIYFGLIAQSDYFSSYNFMAAGHPVYVTGDNKALSIVFTLLQTTLCLTGMMIFRKGIVNNIQAKFLSQPYMIGIGGDSAAGKSTLTNALSAIFEPQNTSIIRGDDMHKWERGNEKWNQYTHLDPKANNLHKDLAQAMSLKTGKGIKRSFYDHSTGKFTLPKFIQSNKIIVFEGLHSFYLKNQTDIYDLKIFMCPDENLRMWWKVQRDVAKRGYAPEQVLEQLRKREIDSEKYIKSQAEKADIIATFFSVNALDPLDQSTEPQLALKLIISNNLYLDPLIESIDSHPGIEVIHTYKGEKQELTFVGGIPNDVIDYIAFQLIPELEEVGVYNAQWKDDYEGLLQLSTVYIAFNKLKLSSEYSAT